MNKHSAIIAGIDFSDSSPIVLRQAIHAAESCETTVIAMHVLEKSKQQYLEESGLKKSNQEALEAQASDRFEKLVAGKEYKVHIEFVVKAGKPAEELCKAAEDAEASFIVLSANDLTKKRLGSVAARCVRTSPCDVLILRDWQGGDFKKIAVCTDFSETADRAIQRAASLAKLHGASLEIINVAYPPNQDSWGEVMDHRADSVLSYEDECREVVRGKMEKCVKRNEEVLEGARYETLIIESEMPSVAITEHVKSVGSDLVVLGTQGHSPFVSHFIGTNAERLLQDAPVSVFAVR